MVSSQSWDDEHEEGTIMLLTINLNINVNGILEMFSRRRVTRRIVEVIGGCAVIFVAPTLAATGSCHLLCHLGTCIKGCVSTDSSFTSKCDQCKCTFGWKGSTCDDLAPIHFIGIFCGIFVLILLCILGCNLYKRLQQRELPDEDVVLRQPQMTRPGTRPEPPPHDPHFVPLRIDVDDETPDVLDELPRNPRISNNMHQRISRIATLMRYGSVIEDSDSGELSETPSDQPSIYGYLQQDEDYTDDECYTPPWQYTPSMARKSGNVGDQDYYIYGSFDEATPPGTPSKTAVPTIVISHAS